MAGRVKRFFRNLFWDLAALTEWWPWLSSWFDTWSVLCDEEAMKAIREVEKWKAEGTLDQHTVPLSEVLEKAGWTQEDVENAEGAIGLDKIPPITLSPSAQKDLEEKGDPFKDMYKEELRDWLKARK